MTKQADDNSLLNIRISYEQGSTACQNYSRLTMQVRTLSQQLLIASAIGLAILAYNIDLENQAFVWIVFASGLVLIGFTVSLALVGWHYQSAFESIRDSLARMERQQVIKGPWSAHQKARPPLYDFLSSYVPFVVLWGLGFAVCLLAIVNLNQVSVWTVVVFIAAIVVPLAALLEIFRISFKRTRDARRNETEDDDPSGRDDMASLNDPNNGGPSGSEPSSRPATTRSAQTPAARSTTRGEEAEGIILRLDNLDVSTEHIQRCMDRHNMSHCKFLPRSEVPAPEDVFALVTVRTPVDSTLLESYPNVRVVAVAFTGYDHVELPSCKERNIAVYNVPTYSTNSVAELTVALAIALLRQIPQADKLIRQGTWQLPTPGVELAGKKIGIIGTGRIGMRVAELFRSFECELYGWTLHPRQEFRDLGGTYLDTPKAVCKCADVVSIHVAMNDETRNLIGEEELEAMGPETYLINTARGAIIDHDALVSVVQNERLAGVALDTYETEPLPRDEVLLTMTSTVLVPHIGFKTREALDRRAEETFANIARSLRNDDRNRIH